MRFALLLHLNIDTFDSYSAKKCTPEYSEMAFTKTRPGQVYSTFDPLIPYRIGGGGSPKGPGSRGEDLSLDPRPFSDPLHIASLLTALRRTRPTQIPNRQSKVAGILSEHARQCDIISDKGGDDPKGSSCGVDGGATGEFGDEEEEEGYV
jgi:hypothetical protein